MMSTNGVIATGRADIHHHGTGSGYYRTEGGFLSDTKRIHDNDYYQVSAYDIRTSIAYEHYQDMLKALLHVAGTKSFGTFVYKNAIDMTISVANTSVTQA